MPDVNMPKLSDTMEEGTVLEWKVEDGQEVKKGDAIAEIESDKASFDIEAEADGPLHIVVGKGESAPVGQLIATIGGEAPAKKPAEPSKPAPEEPAPEAKQPAEAETDEAQPEAAAGKEAPEREEAPAAREPEQEPEAEPAEEPPAGEPARGARDGVKASPIARRLAEERGVDLGSIKGTGPEGRIVKEDVLRAAQPSGRRPGPAAQPPRPTPRPRTGPDVEVEEPTRMQATIARRMAQSKTTVPHFYVTVEANVEEAVKMRQQLKETVSGADRVTMTDMLVRACTLALLKYPEVNASWVDGHFERKRSINIGLAVPPEQGLGLLVPVIHACEQKDLVQVSIEARQVIERARSGRPGPGDLEGGTFSISNLGMYGVDEFQAIINPPEAGILAVGAIKDAPVVDGGQLRVGKVMRMTLSVDHRVFYGVTGAQFLAEVRRMVENPVALVLPPGD
jgi:pyruvate dehydrogenase E2 component (dihydrolipoyllysine-residue acetyltransferase)